MVFQRVAEVAAIQTSHIPTPVATKQTGAYALLDSLHRHGVKHIFGYPGVRKHLFVW